MRVVAFVLASLCLLCAGCAVKPVQHAGTAEVRCTSPQFTYRLVFDPGLDDGPAPGTPTASTVPDDSGALAAAMQRAYKSGRVEAYRPEDEPVTNSILVLSGGGQDGAFGAGFLDGWSRLRSQRAALPGNDPRKTGLPRFRVVTGISTGSLQASFAFIDQLDPMLGSYTIARERELLDPLVSRPLKDRPVRGAIALARHGTLATLDPLRRHLATILTDDRLALIAHEASDHEGGRVLLVGAVEMDSGDLVVFNLGEIARAWVAEMSAVKPGEVPSPRAAALKHCYIEALIASSSVPMAAPPVFIDGKMFIDGGARMGVFVRRLDREINLVGRLDQDGLPRDSLFMLINGTLKVQPTCNLGECPNPRDRWRFDGLAFRSLSVLINQSYVSSVYWSRNEAARRNFVPEFARMLEGADGYLQHRADAALPGEPAEVLSCQDWRNRDEARDHPIEFHPRYMRCLIDYGRHHPALAKWAELE